MNLYTELKIRSFERIAFAHSLATANYRYELRNFGYGVYGRAPADGGILEIGFVEQNPLVFTVDGREFVIEENGIFIIPPESGFSVAAQNEGLHRHTSAEFLIRYQKKPAEAFSPAQGKRLTLPLSIAPSPAGGEVFSHIRSIVRSKMAQNSRGYFEECADFMLLLHKLLTLLETDETRDGVSPGNRRYCDRAKAFVSENINRKICVGDVAAAVGVSKNYLTNVFSAGEGIGLMEYINRRKLSYLLELIRRYHYPLAEACEHVGFTDSNYVSRIFKRYYGTTLTEYKRDHFQ